MEVNINVEVPERLKKFLANPTPYISGVMKAADKESLILLQRDIAAAAPKKSGKMSRSVKYNLPLRKVYTESIYGRAVELGHYAEAKPGRHLRFRGNAQRTGYVFPTKHYKGRKGFEDLKGQWYSAIRTQKQPYFFPTFHRDKVKILQIYDKAFERLIKNI